MKINVGVIFGGKSVEHEISIISAVQAMAAFDTEKYNVVPIYISKDNIFYTAPHLKNIDSFKNIDEALKKSHRINFVKENGKVLLVSYPAKPFRNNIAAEIDVAFPVVHGTNVEDGSLQGFLEMFDIPYAGCDVVSSAVGMDKFITKSVLKDFNIPVLDCVSLEQKEYLKSRDENIEKIEKEIGYPVIIKPVNLGSSVGIKKASDRNTLIQSIDYAFEFSPRVIAERAVENLKEINCSVLGDYQDAKASECEEPVNSDEILSYSDKYMSEDSGAKGMSSLKRKLPAEISVEEREKVRDYAVRAFKCLGCNGVVRIDFLMNTQTREIWLNEVNTIPGSLSFYLWEATDMPFANLLDNMVQLSLKRRREKESLNFSYDTEILKGFSFGGKTGKFSKTGAN